MRDPMILATLHAHPSWWADKVAARLIDYPHPEACWVWSGARIGAHGSVKLPGGPTVLTHRVTWLALRGPIPQGLVLDHDGPQGCHNRLCANPAHLDAVTQMVNQHNGPRTNAAKTHCRHGHLLGGDNVFPGTASAGRRKCRTCSIEGSRRISAAAHALGLNRLAYIATYGYSQQVARELIATHTVERTAR